MVKDDRMFGWTGKILRVDLENMTFSIEPTEKYIQFIGGRGIQQWILLNELSPEVQPLDSDNLLIFGTGPLTGTETPACNFMSISSKNVFNGGTNFSHVGGFFAPELKFAGYDQIVISGKAEKPVYLWIDNERTELRDASHLWGKTTSQTEEIIRRMLGDDLIRVACIGPAGENLVSFAAIMVDKTRAAAGGGIGAVMGSKNLKAIAVRGTDTVKIADPNAFKKAVAASLKKIKESGTVGYPTHFITSVMNNVCLIPVRNVEDDHWDEKKLGKIDLIGIKKYKSKEKREACFNCILGCGNHIYEVKEGPYAGLKSRLFEASSAYSFGSRMDIDYFPGILKAFEQVSDLGLDESSCGVVISWAFDCYQRGIISKEDTGGYELKWGDHQTLNELIRKIAYREGFGDLLAEGVMRASKVIGKGSEYFAPYVKGQGLADTVRAAKGWALGIMTATRGGRHMNGAPATEYWNLPPDICQACYGVPSAGDGRKYEGKAKLVHWYEQLKALVDTLVVCYNTSYWISPLLLGPNEYASMLSPAIGRDLSGEELMMVGLRIQNIEKAINTLHAGFIREDDLPPRVFMEEPVKSGAMKGERLEREKWDEMLTEYYELQGWDPETSWQKRDILIELGLNTVADKLKEKGRLIE